MSRCHKVSLLALLIVFSFFLSAVNSYPQSVNVFAQTEAVGEIKKVHVGDTDIGYKMFGTGDPIILISGYSAPLEFWDPSLIEKLASNHTVIFTIIRYLLNHEAMTELAK